jgi:hypothetical protein
MTVSPVAWKAARRSTLPVADTVNLDGLKEAVPVSDVVAKGTVKVTAPVAPLNDDTTFEDAANAPDKSLVCDSERTVPTWFL